MTLLNLIRSLSPHRPGHDDERRRSLDYAAPASPLTKRASLPSNQRRSYSLHDERPPISPPLHPRLSLDLDHDHHPRAAGAVADAEMHADTAAGPVSESTATSTPYMAPDVPSTHHWFTANAALTAASAPTPSRRRVASTLDTIADVPHDSDLESLSAHTDADSDSEPDLTMTAHTDDHAAAAPAHLDRLLSTTSLVLHTNDVLLHVASPAPSLPGPNLIADWVLTATPPALPPSPTCVDYMGATTAVGHPAHSLSHTHTAASSPLTARPPLKAAEQHVSQAHVRGLSLLDEDDQLATHLDATAFDALEDAGEEEEEDQRRAASRRSRKRTPSSSGRRQVDEEEEDDVHHWRAEAAASEGKKLARAAIVAQGSSNDLSATAARLASSPREEIGAPGAGKESTSGTGGEKEESHPKPPEPVRGATTQSTSTMDEDDAAFLAAVNRRLDPAAKLRALREEFGLSRVSYSLEQPKAEGGGDASVSTQQEDDGEVFIGSASAVLFRTVLIRGSLLVTNHRLCFFAMLPPPLGTSAHPTPGGGSAPPSAPDSGAAGARAGSLPLNASEDGSSDHLARAESGSSSGIPSSPSVPTDPALSNPILIKGPATLHRTGWRRKRRCWFELRADGFCAYPSSEQLYQPLGSIRLQDIEEICPADFKRVTWLSVKVVGGKTASLEFNTEEACLAWRRELEAALFTYRNSSDKIRISIPLARIAGVERIGMLHFAITSTIRVFEHEPGAGKASSRLDGASNINKTRDVAFGVTKRNADLIDNLVAHLQTPTKWREQLGFEEAMRRTPTAVIEVEGSRVQDEQDLDSGDEGDKPSLAPAIGAGEIAEKVNQDTASTPISGTRASSVAVEKTLSKGSAKSETSPPQASTESPEEAAARAKQIKRAERFIEQFALKAQPEDLTLFKADIVRTIPSAGTLAISTQFLCFWRRRLGSLPDIRLKIPVSDLVGVSTSRAFRWHVWGLSLHIRGHADLPFEFHDHALRDRAIEQIQALVQSSEKSRSQIKIDTEVVSNAAAAVRSAEDTTSTAASASGGSVMASPATATSQHSSEALQGSEGAKVTDLVREAKQLLDQGPDEEVLLDRAVINYVPKVINVPAMAIRKVPPMSIFCLTIGSRGDVQPYIALGKALQGHGHKVTIVSHPEYEKWVRGHGIDYRPVGGDPGKLMQLSVEHRILSPSFFRESIGKFRDWLDELLRESWEQCQGADLLIESPSTMSGIHVAEGLGIPYFRAFTMPWTQTSAYPQAFSVPPFDMGPSYNQISYTLFDSIMWRATSGQINRWRKHMLGLKSTDATQLEVSKVPFVYNFSEAVVPFPNDWGSLISISGYWNLKTEKGEWDPPEDLVSFLDKARQEGKKIAYIGFGSITVPDPVALSKAIYTAVKAADVRAVVSKGWSARMHKGGGSKEEEPVPPECYVVDSIPHDWLFPRIDIALHHGGAGTTGASLRDGLVTLIKPFFGDQFFWALRVQKLGAGARVSSLDAGEIGDALKKAADDRVMVEKAQEVGRKIRAEDGATAAISFIYSNLNIAKRTRHEREPSVSWTASLMRSDTSNTTAAAKQEHPLSDSGGGTQSEHEDVLSDDGGGDGGPTSRKHRSLKLVKSPFSSSSGSVGLPRGPGSSAASASSGKHPVPTSAVATPTLTPSSEANVSYSTDSPDNGGSSGDSGSAAKKNSSTFSRLPALPSLSIPSMPSLPMPNVIKDLVGSDTAGVKSPEDESDAGKAGADSVDKSGGPAASAKKTEEPPKKAPSRSYKALKAEDQRRAKLMAERIQRELDRGATPVEAARIQAQQAAADSAEKARLADEEAEKEAAREKEKERKARTKSSHGLPSFVHSSRKSIDISGLWPSVASHSTPSSMPPPPSSASADAPTAVGPASPALNGAALTASVSVDSGAVTAATAATAGVKPASVADVTYAETDPLAARPANLERRVTDSKVAEVKVHRRISLRNAVASRFCPPSKLGSNSPASPELKPKDIGRPSSSASSSSATVRTASSSGAMTPASVVSMPATLSASGAAAAAGDSGTTLRPSEGPGSVKSIEDEEAVDAKEQAPGVGVLGEPLHAVKNPASLEQ
ncbi:hypothetical protein V8E36_004136 [Tilletia maclaganii]